MHGCLMRELGTFSSIIFTSGILALFLYYVIGNKGLKNGWKEFLYDLDYEEAASAWFALLCGVGLLGIISLCGSFSIKHAELEATTYADLIIKDCEKGFDNELPRVANIDGVEYNLPPSKGRKNYLRHVKHFKYWAERADGTR